MYHKLILMKCNHWWCLLECVYVLCKPCSSLKWLLLICNIISCEYLVGSQHGTDRAQPSQLATS